MTAYVERVRFVTRILHRVYLFGYVGSVVPRACRRIVAGSELHRAWLSGLMGIFYDHTGRRCGVLDRQDFRARK